MKQAKTTWLLAGAIFISILFVFGSIIRNGISLSTNLEDVNNTNKLTGKLKDLQTGIAVSGDAFATYLLEKDVASRTNLVRSHRKINEQFTLIKKTGFNLITKENFANLENLIAQKINYEKSAITRSVQQDSSLQETSENNISQALNALLDNILKLQNDVLKNQTAETKSLETTNNLLAGTLGILVIVTLFVSIKVFNKGKQHESIANNSTTNLTNEEAELLVASVSYKEVEDILSKEEENATLETLRHILSFSQEALLVINKDGIITVINNAAQSLFKSSAAIEINNSENISKLSETIFAPLLKEIAQVSRGERNETKNIIRNNDEYYEYKCLPIYGGQIITAAICYLSNITEETKTSKKAQQLETQNILLAKALDEQTSFKNIPLNNTFLNEDFFNSIEHELRTPVNDIIGVSSMLNSSVFNAEQKEFLQLINQSSDKLLSLIDNVHLLSKIEAGKVKLKTQSFNLSATLAAIINEQRKKHAAGSVELQLLHDVTIADSIAGDQHLLNYVLSLLIDLGTSAMQQGIVKLFVQQTNTAGDFINLNFTLRFSSNNISKYLRSFNESSKEDIFNLTNQAPINLIAAEKLVLMQKGNIAIKTNNDHKADIIVTLSYALANENKIAEPIANNKCNTTNEILIAKSVLVAEDNQINQKILLNFLEKQQMHVTIANNGKEVIDALQNKIFDCILLDIKMPEMDGIQTAAFIRNKLQLNIPIIAITASNIIDEKEKCHAYGINKFITRPFAFTDLSASLMQLLSTENAKQTNTLVTSIEHNNYNKFYSLQSVYAVGDNDYCSGVLDFFLKDSPYVFKSIQLNLALEKYDEVIKTIQKFRSSLSVLQMHVLLECINNIEDKITHKKNIEAIAADIIDAIEVFRVMKPMIDAEISSLRKTVA